MKDGVMRFFESGGSPVLVLPSNARRTGLIFSANAGASLYVGTTDAISDAHGLHIAGSLPPVKLCKCEVGGYVQRAWFLTDDGSGGTLTVVELLD